MPTRRPAAVPPARAPIPPLPADVLMKVFAYVGWLDISPLRDVCRDWRTAADTAAGTLRAVGVRSHNRVAPLSMLKRRLTPSRVVNAVRFFPVLRSLSLSPGRHATGRAGPSGGPFAGPSAAVVAAVFCAPAAGSILAALEFVDLSDVGRERTTKRNRQPDPLRPSDFTILAAAGSRLRHLRVARCRWWTDDFVRAVVGGRVAPTWRGDAGEERVPRLRQLDMSCSGVTLAAVVTCWSIGVDQVDVSGCRGVEGALELVPTWVSASVDGGGEPTDAGGAAGGREAETVAGVAAESSAPCPSSQRRGILHPPSRLDLCSTRLTSLRVTGAPRFAPRLDVNASDCPDLVVVDLSSAPLVHAHFPRCGSLAYVPLLDPRANRGGGAGGAGVGGARAASAAIHPRAFAVLKVLSLFDCHAVEIGRLKLSGGTFPALAKLVVHGLEVLTHVDLDALPALAPVDAGGCPSLTSVVINACPLLQLLDLRCRKAPLSHVAIEVPGGGTVLGVRKEWVVRLTTAGQRIFHQRGG